MGTFSIWHWLVVIIWLGLPAFFVLRPAPNGPNRFGPPSTTASFTEAISRFFKNYVNFSGRATRSEFWFAILAVFIMTLVLSVLDAAAFGADAAVLSGLFSLGIFIPSIALSCRRLHDLNRSGWHQILSYVFPVGTIGVLIWYCKAGTDTTEHSRDMHDVGRHDRNTYSTLNSMRDAHSFTARTQSSLSRDSLEMLERLSKLKADGAITADEYESQKRKLLE